MTLLDYIYFPYGYIQKVPIMYIRSRKVGKIPKGWTYTVLINISSYVQPAVKK